MVSVTSKTASKMTGTFFSMAPCSLLIMVAKTDRTSASLQHYHHSRVGHELKFKARNSTESGESGWMLLMMVAKRVRTSASLHHHLSKVGHEIQKHFY